MINAWERTPAAAGDPGEAEFAFAYAGLFALVFSLTQAGLIVYFRSGLYVPGRLLLLAAGLFGCAAFAPFCLPAALRQRMSGARFGYPLVSFLVLASGLLAYLPGGAAGILVYVYSAGALAGLLRARSSLGLLRARHFGFLVLALVFGAYVFFCSNVQQYAGVFAPEQALAGKMGKDTYFATAIAHMIQNFGVSSTGVDGLVRHRYHVGAHAWFGALGRAAGTMPLLTYPFAHQITLLPAQVLALGFSLAAAGRRRAAAAGPLGAAVMMVVITDSLGRPSHYVSETYAAGITCLLFFWPLLLDLVREPNRGRRMDLVRLVLSVMMVLALMAVKISVGILFTLALAWVLLRVYGFRARPLGFIALAGLGALAMFKTFNDPGQAAVLAPLQFFRTHPRLLFFGNWIIPGLYVFSIVMNNKISGRAGLAAAVRSRAAVGGEALVLIALAASLPAFLFRLSNAWAWFFFNAPIWPAMVMLAAEWDWKPVSASRYRRAYYGAAVLLAALCAWSLARHLGSKKVEYLWRTRELARTAAGPNDRAPEKPRPYGAGLDGLLGAEPGYRAYAIIMDELARTGKNFAVYVPASNREFWRITPNCLAQPMFVPAVTGRPMLRGLPPEDLECKLVFYGYPNYGPESRAGQRSDAEVCAGARERGFPAVLVLSSLADRAENRVLTCGGR